MTTRRHVSVRSRLIVGTAAMALIASACGGDSSGGGTAESWCDFANESDVVDDIFDSLGADPAATEAGLKQVEGFVKRLPNEAPPEIADDAKVLAEGTQMLIDAFAKADYNIADADLSFMADAELETRLDAAGDNMDAYTQKECGRPFGSGSSDGTDADPDADIVTDTNDSSDPGDFDPANGTLRDQLIAQFESIGLANDEATCIAGNLDFADPAVQSGDIAAMLDVFTECGIDIARLAELGAG
jgi:hypothetical protein